MAETYCGKSCSECTQKEAMHCPGCKEGPGKQFGGDCTLAECVRSKGHETCDTCGFSGSCGSFIGREHQPEYRKKRQELELQQKQADAKRVPILGKWLWLLFWLVVPSTVASLMSNEAVMQAAPGVYMAGQILSAVCSVAYGIFLLKLAPAEEHYSTAGFCALVCAGVSILVAVLSGGAKAPVWTLLLTIPSAVFGLIGEHSEYTAHAIVLRGFDSELSGKWEFLWKCYIGLTLAMLACVFVVGIAPVLGLIALLVAAIGLVIVRIEKLVYLYKTARIFK